MSRLSRVAAVIVTLTAAALATTAQSDAHAASAGTAATVARAAATPHTRLVVHVTGCDRCSIAAQQAVSGRLHVWSGSYHRVGSDHRVVLRIRTSRTHGMSFLFRAPWAGNTGAVSNVVTRYAGQSVDGAVTRADARQARRAEGCWAGTTQSRERLDLHVSRVRARTLDGRPTHLPLVYATHTLSSWKPVMRTYKGTIGNQDAFWCTKP